MPTIIEDIKNNHVSNTPLNHGRPPSRNKLTHLLAVVPRRVRMVDCEITEKTVDPTISTATNQRNNCRNSRLL